MTHGYYKMHRGWMQHPVFRAAEYTEREAWVWLIEHAAYKDVTVRIGEYLADLKHGQLAYSIRFLASKWDWNPAKVQRFLKRLKNRYMIDTRTDTGITIITLCNYYKYQDIGCKTDTPINTKPIQSRYIADTKKKEIINKEKEESAPQKLDKSVYIGLSKRKSGGENLTEQENRYIQQYETQTVQQAIPAASDTTGTCTKTPLWQQQHGQYPLFDAFTEQLEPVLGAETLSSWFSAMQCEEITDGTLTLSFSSRFICQEIKTRHLDRLESIWLSICDHAQSIELTVRQAQPP